MFAGFMKNGLMRKLPSTQYSMLRTSMMAQHPARLFAVQRYKEYLN